MESSLITNPSSVRPDSMALFSRRLLKVFAAVLVLCSGCSKDSTKPAPITADTVPPAAVLDLAVTSPPGRLITLTWTAPGDDGTDGHASQYEIRYATTPITEQGWDSAAAVASPPTPRAAGEMEHLNISGLPDGTYYFALKTADEVPNWSGSSNVILATVADVVPPGAVTDLIVSYVTARAATLTWTAPGNDGATGRAAEYDLRYSTDLITDGTWEAASRAQGTPAPGSAGAHESFTINGLETGQTYSFALKTADETPNWSILSNVTSAVIEDVSAPSMVRDLAACSADVQSVTLSWTAPGNNGDMGRAVVYDLRYALEPIAEWNWDAATPVQGVAAPDTAGAAETFVVTGLNAGGTYYFALKTADEVPNWSAMSNSIGATVASPTLQRLTFHQGAGHGVGSPAWSPDGQKILFHAQWSGEWYTQLYTMSGACESPVQFTNHPGDNRNPCWSPNGNEIAFVSDRTSNNPIELWIMGAFPGASARRLVQQDGWLLGQCTWSPDGTRIAYEAWSFDMTQDHIYVVPTAGGAPSLLTDDSYRSRQPAWSPDGTGIAFDSDRSGNYDIWVMPAAGGDPVQLTDDPGYDGHPTWSPDGSRIAFTSDRSGDFEIWIMSATGENPIQVTDDRVGYYTPAWSPDGNRIAFTTFQGAVWDIWILSLRQR